jgi:ribosomal protein S18 acetylase RimI-like enzyme
MAAHALDNPVWHSLTTRHAGLAITAEGAARYPADIVPFAGIGEPTHRAGDQLTSLIEDAESVFIVGVAPAPPPGWRLEPRKPVLQMICDTRMPEVPGPAVTTMTAAEVPDMVALTELVFPGFFRPRTLEMGSYYGIYDGRRLAAMAGERMRLDGYQELSAVCTHPQYTGRGYAQRLLSILCNSAFDRGFAPFLHVYTDNARAIGVYRRMSFVDRAVLPFWALHQ